MIPEEKRKLAAVMFTDIVGYTTMTQANEARTLEQLRSQRSVLRPIFKKHSGAEIKTVGDAFLVEFESALDATRCAIEIQRTLRGRGAGVPEESPAIRIGIHLGDVVHSENDVLGDAVNIASRVESIADSGEICVSQQVYDQVRNKLEDCTFIRLEGRQLKNVALPIGVYRLVMGGAAGVVSPAQPHARRVAVLPLANFSPDPNDGYLADAITDELINSLSKMEGLRLIARTSVMGYKGTTKSISEVGGTLRVGSILQGSLLKSTNRVRISLQLIDSESEEQLWANKYDRELNDIFAIQDDIAQKVTESLKVRLAPGGEEKAKPTEDMDAYTHYLRGRTLLYDRTEPAMREALKHFEEAAKLDPRYARAYAGMADAYFLLGYFSALPFAEACSKAKELAGRALGLDPLLAEPHATLGVILSDYDHDYGRAEEEFRKAISVNPSYAQAHHWHALALATVGRMAEATEEMKKARDADPLSPQIRVIMGTMLSWAGRDDDALREWRTVLERNPDFPNLYYQRAVHYIDRGQKELALADVAKKLKLTPGETLAEFLVGYAAAHFGDRAKALEVLERLRASSREKPVPSLFFAHLYAALGDYDQFFS